VHILLTDVLTCPRCGPDFGLILLADRMGNRRVVDGHLGCPNCRAHYPVRDRVVDLRIDGSAETSDVVDVVDAIASADASDPGAGRGGDEAAMRLAALMGLAGASGTVLVAGPGAGHAAAVAALVPELEVIALAESTESPVPIDDDARVSPVRTSGAGLPFRGGLRAAALTGAADDARLREGLRVLSPGARLVVDPAPAGTADALRALGAEVLLDEDGVVVARAPGRPVELRYNAVR
jgi:uncharacterized protein YbaR (Trm112 family)